MSIGTYERGTTFQTILTLVSGSSYVNCSGNMAYLSFNDPAGSEIFSDISGTHDSTGIYSYYVSTNSSHNLGLYELQWKFMLDLGRHGWQWKEDSETVSIVEIE